MAYSLTYLLPEWQLTVRSLNADGGGVMEFKTLMLRESLKSSKTSWNFGHSYIEVIFGIQRRRLWSLLQRTRGEARQVTWRLSSRRRWVTSVETRGGHESRQRSNCTITLVKWSDCGDFLKVKSWTTAIAGGIVSSIELFPYAEHQSGSRRRSTNVCKLRQVVRQQACRPFPLYSL